MKDIDFDELDRAVGTVLGADAAAPKQADTVAVETKPAAAAPAEPAIVSEPETTTPATIKPATSPARKRGQFLDMVHPSADMRGNKTPMPTGPRKTLSPLNPSFTPAEPEASSSYAPVEPTPLNTSVDAPIVADVAEPTQTTPVEHDSPDNTVDVGPEEPLTLDLPQVADTQEAPKTDEPAWPDPLDVAPGGDDEKETAETDDMPDLSDLGADETTNQTPFVPGVEVEKRPLGGGPSVDPPAPTSPLTSPDVSVESAEPAELTPQTAPTPSDLSGPEMSEEINSIESNGVRESEAPADTTAEARAKATDTPVEEKKPEVTSAPVSAAADAPVGAQSIPQQYKPAEKKADDEDNHPLFDTEEYHQPLLPTGKKKSGKGVLLIVLFVILVLVGCALGYLAFNMGL